MSKEFDTDKTDEAAVMNRSFEYFKNHDFFDKEEFEGTVFPNEKVTKSFREYNEIYSEENQNTLQVLSTLQTVMAKDEVLKSYI